MVFGLLWLFTVVVWRSSLKNGWNNHQILWHLHQLDNVLAQLFRHCVEQTPFNRFPLLSHFSEFGAQFLFYQGVMYQTKGTCSRFRCLLLIFFFLINPVTDLHVIKLKFIGVRLEFLFYFRITIQHKKSFFFVYVRSTLYWSHFVPPALTVMMF